MACKREARFRRNTIAFWLSDEEKAQVEARIILSGIPKGDYYRKAVLGQAVTVTAGNYMSNRVAKVLGQILEHLRNGNTEDEKLLMELIKQLIEIGQDEKLLMELIKQLIEIGQNENAPAGNRDISKTD